MRPKPERFERQIDRSRSTLIGDLGSLLVLEVPGMAMEGGEEVFDRHGGSRLSERGLGVRLGFGRHGGGAARLLPWAWGEESQRNMEEARVPLSRGGPSDPTKLIGFRKWLVNPKPHTKIHEFDGLSSVN